MIHADHPDAIGLLSFGEDHSNRTQFHPRCLDEDTLIELDRLEAFKGFYLNQAKTRINVFSLTGNGSAESMARGLPLQRLGLQEVFFQFENIDTVDCYFEAANSMS